MQENARAIILNLWSFFIGYFAIHNVKHVASGEPRTALFNKKIFFLTKCYAFQLCSLLLFTHSKQLFYYNTTVPPAVQEEQVMPEKRAKKLNYNRKKRRLNDRFKIFCKYEECFSWYAALYQLKHYFGVKSDSSMYYIIFTALVHHCDTV